MGLEMFLSYVESLDVETYKSVDLFDLARQQLLLKLPAAGVKSDSSRPLSLLVDGECCLDRFYGGYYSDWVSGGQWNRMVAFITNLSKACKFYGLHLTVCLRSGSEKDHEKEFFRVNMDYRTKMAQVLKHVQSRGTPPPKVWWIPPTGLRDCLSMALQLCGIQTLCTGADYYKELALYCHVNNINGIISDNATFALFCVPRIFAAHEMKLTYKGNLETKEYYWNEVLRAANLPADRLPLLASLLGNHIVDIRDLEDFHKDLLKDTPLNAEAQNKKNREMHLIRELIAFVQKLGNPGNLSDIGSVVFHNSKDDLEVKISSLQQSVEYYKAGTDYFAAYVGKSASAQSSHTALNGVVGASSKEHTKAHLDWQEAAARANHCNGGFPGHDQSSAGNSSTNVAGSSADSSLNGLMGHMRLCAAPCNDLGLTAQPCDEAQYAISVTAVILRIAADRHRRGLMSTWIYQVISERKIRLLPCIENESSLELPSYVDLYRPVRQGAYSILFNLNKTHFDLRKKAEGHTVEEGTVKVEVTETFYRGSACEHVTVTATPLYWSVPSVETLWLGVKPENHSRRLKAFLTLMRSDALAMMNCDALVQSTCVPEHYLFACCVLRYLLHADSGAPVLRMYELDAFLSMCTSSILYDVQTMQDMQLPALTSRGILLAALFMAGVQHATLANDVCGSPVPREATYPWLYFDGKLFQYKLLKAMSGAPLLDLCDGLVDQLLKVESLKLAILKGIPETAFANPPPAEGASASNSPTVSAKRNVSGGRLAKAVTVQPQQRPVPPAASAPAVPNRNSGSLLGEYALHGSGGNSANLVDQRGGQLQIAGQVVASWGPNLIATRPGMANSRAVGISGANLSTVFGHPQRLHTAMLASNYYNMALYQGAPAILSTRYSEPMQECLRYDASSASKIRLKKPARVKDASPKGQHGTTSCSPWLLRQSEGCPTSTHATGTLLQHASASMSLSVHPHPPHPISKERAQEQKEDAGTTSSAADSCVLGDTSNSDLAAACMI